MITLLRILSFLLLLYISPVWSQTIRFEDINSRTALDLVSLADTDQTPQTTPQTIIWQNGYANYMEAYINSSSELSVLQTGDYNYLNFNNGFTHKPSKTAVSTQGYNNIIDITGSNGISDKMKINIQGDNMTIFVRNY